MADRDASSEAETSARSTLPCPDDDSSGDLCRTEAGSVRAPSGTVGDLLAIMAALRTPGSGCAWDLAQSHESLVPFVLEEAYEVADAIERGDLSDLRDELGDLLLQVVFHARLAEENGVFAFADVVRSIEAKMIRRHPHVFAAGGGTPIDAASVVGAWERIKDEERAGKRTGRTVDGIDANPEAGGSRVLADVPLALPGLTRALKLQKKASRVGFDWGDVRLVLLKLREEIDEIEDALDAPGGAKQEEVAGEIGDLLFAAANLARHAGVDPEASLRGTNAKFERRFAFIEQHLAARGSSPERSTLAEMDALWDEAKRAGL